MRPRVVLAALLSMLAIGTGAARAQEAPLVAAAASLQFALPEIAQAFAGETGETVEIVYGSSGNLTRQIRQGAPFDLFLSADESFAEALEADGLTIGAGAVYAEGRLALFVPNGSALAADGTLDNLAAALAEGRITRFAIASPEHAPYGKRAEEVLRHRDLWDTIRPLLVIGENVAQAAQFAASGNAAGGLIALSLAVAPAVASHGRSAEIPADWHAPLRQRMVLLQSSDATAERFFAFMQGPTAQAILLRHGFAPPGLTG